jgi:aminoglycoside phosphotransferase family enzyme
MPIITQADLATNIYAEIITEISRSDSTVVTAAINAAVNEAKMYLARFDLLQLFGTDEAQPVVQDEYLKSLVKDIACWHLVRLSNPGVDLATYRTAYQDAIAALKAIMAGAAQPSGWPYIDTTAETTPPGDSISWQSNPKRNNYY